MSMCQDMYNSICNAKIQNSIFCASKLIMRDPDKNFEILINTLIAICSYIGSFISLYDIRLLIDIINDIFKILEDSNIVMKDIYVVITKMCILCDIYIKNPILKTGVINIKLLRDQIIDMFEKTNYKLSESGITRFEGIIVPIDSPSYNLSMQIITGYVFIIKELEKLTIDTDADKIEDIANKLRKSFDYIIRKKYTFETKYYESDNDAVWFLWGIISIMYNEPEMDAIYQLFNIGYSKKTKQHRVGLLWAAAIMMVYMMKKNISRNWNAKEIQIIKQIEQLSLDIYKDIKKELISKHEIEVDVSMSKKNTSVDGLEYISNIRHYIDESNDHIEVPPSNEDAEIKMVKCKRSTMNSI